GGSYYVEALTTAIEEKALRYLEVIERMGGASQAIAFMQEEVHRAAYEHQLAVESGDRIVVGVNAYQEDSGPLEIEQPNYSEFEAAQRERLVLHRQQRDARVV